MADGPKRQTTTVYLTDEELAVLDRRCGAKTQEKVNEALRRLDLAKGLDGVPTEWRDFVGRVLEELEKEGRLIHRVEWVRRCPVCGKSAGYATYKRTRGTHRKGDPNYSKPLQLRAVELAHRFVRVNGSVSLGCCLDCMKEVRPYLGEVLRGRKGEFPKSLTGETPKWKRVGLKRCKKCGWEGSEARIGKLRTLMGDGWYPGRCPECGAEQVFLGPDVFEVLDGYDLVPVKPKEI